jgi:phage N-6-adenine-methyltransferase
VEWHGVITEIVTTRLSELERGMEKDAQAFVRFGTALLEIRESRLYRDGYETFEDYCRRRWKLKQSRAYQLMDAAFVTGSLKSSTIVELPANEAQARPLTVLPPEVQVKAWQKAVETAPNGKVTAAHVQDVVDNLIRDYRKETRPENIHVSDDSYEWYTPAEYIQAARLVMGDIDLDPASCAEANKTVLADEYYTQEDDGLSRDWFGRVWLNPPYNMPNIENFTARAHVLYQNKKIDEAIILVNNSTDAGWFHTLLDNYPVCLTRGRVKYWGPHASQARQGQAIFYLGKNKQGFIKRFSPFGIVVSKSDNS